MQGLQSPISFIVNRSDLEGRFEPEYYRPSIREIEDRIRSKAQKKLRDFIKKISSGATPSVQEEEKYYSDKENGVPFLRVQNLQTNSQLNLEDVKYINRVTHEKYLKRSQVSGGDLLVKITGVGRMAIASVAPEGFEGNTNQHMVVIKTDDKSVSEYLAFYLNLDIVEKISSRRSTGGTRPALDYPALKSIPIVEGLDFSEVRIAETVKEKNVLEARLLQKGINLYLASQLGIAIPTINKNDFKKFISSFSDLTGGRFDPYYSLPYYKELLLAITNAQFKYKHLSELVYPVRGVTYSYEDEIYTDDGLAILRANNITLDTNELNFDDVRYIRTEFPINKVQRLRANDILMSAASGSKEHVGKVAFIEKDIPYYFGGFMMVLRIKSDEVLPEYLFNFLQSNIFRDILFRSLGGTNINNLTFSMIAKFPIPCPPVIKQREINTQIEIIRNNIRQLKNDGEAVVYEAKKKIEQLILS